MDKITGPGMAKDYKLKFIILQNDLIKIPQNYAARHEVPPGAYMKVSTKEGVEVFLAF